jgi:glycosyltransferase involved in cell wall biosynthesis
VSEAPYQVVIGGSTLARHLKKTTGTVVQTPLRIAAHNGSRIYGGGEKAVVRLLKGLQERGHLVHLFCNHSTVVDQARAQGLEASPGRLGGHLMVPHTVRFAGQLRRYRPHALLLSTFKKVWLGAPAAQLAGVPRVVSRIGLETDLPQRHWTYRLAYRRWVHAVLVNADSIRKDFVRGLPGYDPRRVGTVYNGTRLKPSTLTPTEARRNLGVPTGVPLVGSLTRLSPQKRLDRLLEALALLPGVHLALAGEGELEAELRARADALDIGDRVHFLGYRTDVEVVLEALDVFVISSDTEGMANAMLEAMITGLPVVSTPVSGAQEALAPDVQGRAPGWVTDPSPERLAEAMGRLLADEDVRRKMGEEGRRRARARFSFEAMIDAWEGVLGGDSPHLWHQGPPDAPPSPIGISAT